MTKAIAIKKKIVTEGMSARKIMIEAMPMVKFVLRHLSVYDGCKPKNDNNEGLHASVSTLAASAMVKMHL